MSQKPGIPVQGIEAISYQREQVIGVQGIMYIPGDSKDQDTLEMSASPGTV